MLFHENALREQEICLLNQFSQNNGNREFFNSIQDPILTNTTENAAQNLMLDSNSTRCLTANAKLPTTLPTTTGDIETPRICLESRPAFSIFKGHSIKKIEFVLRARAELQEKCGGRKELLLGKDKRWYNRHITKISTCLYTHFSDDVG